MAEYATKKELEQVVSKAVDDIADIIQSFAQSVDERFNKVEEDIADLKSDVAELDKKYDRLVRTLDHFLKRLDDIETDNTARDAQIARIERWVEQIAAKTGVKLEF